MKKELINYMAIEIPNIIGNEDFVCEAIAEFISQINPTREEINNVKVVVEEAIVNAINFAYPDNIGKIAIRVSIFNDKLLEIKVRDWGCGINNVNEAKQSLYTIDENRHGGLGFTIMEAFMDKLSVRSTPGKGTIVTMKKHINS